MADYELLPQSQKDAYQKASDDTHTSSKQARHTQKLERIEAFNAREAEANSSFMDACFAPRVASLGEGEALPTMPTEMSLGPSDHALPADSLPININSALESNGEAFGATTVDEFKHLLHRSFNLSRSDGLQPFSEHILGSFYNRQNMFAELDTNTTTCYKAEELLKQVTTNFADPTHAPPFPDEVHHELACDDMCARDTSASLLAVYSHLKGFFSRVAIQAGFNHRAAMCHHGRVLLAMRYFALATDEMATITEFYYLNTGLGRWYRFDAFQMLSQLDITSVPEATASYVMPKNKYILGVASVWFAPCVTKQFKLDPICRA